MSLKIDEKVLKERIQKLFAEKKVLSKSDLMIWLWVNYYREKYDYSTFKKKFASKVNSILQQMVLFGELELISRGVYALKENFSEKP